MHPNPAFRGAAEAEILAFARSRGFGQLSINGPEGPLTALVPFELIDPGVALADESGASEALRVRCHLVRSNPLARALSDPSPALLAVHGPDAYVSPNWYGPIPDQVPTWNYVAVHVRGRVRLLPTEALRGHLERVSAWFEAAVAETTGAAPWTLEKMSDAGFTRLARQIIPAELVVERLDGTWKLNQNKPREARVGAVAGFEAMGAAAIGSHAAAEIPRMMRDALEED